MNKAVEFANSARKAVVAAVAVASTVVVMDVPQTVKTVAATVIAVGAVFGITYRVSNKV